MYEAEQKAYERHKHLLSAAADLGISHQTLYWRLRKVGVSVTGDKAKYGSTKDKVAVIGESIFQQLVPHAQNQNELEFQPKVDFVIGSATVDIKTAKPKHGRWGFSIKKQILVADFFVCIGLTATKRPEIYLLIPTDMLREHMQMLSLPTSKKSKWMDFEVSALEITRFFTQESF